MGLTACVVARLGQLVAKQYAAHMPWDQTYWGQYIAQRGHVLTALYTAGGRPAGPPVVIGPLPEDVVGAAHKDVDHTISR